jgi:hypothetical protein
VIRGTHLLGSAHPRSVDCPDPKCEDRFSTFRSSGAYMAIKLESRNATPVQSTCLREPHRSRKRFASKIWQPVFINRELTETSSVFGRNIGGNRTHLLIASFRESIKARRRTEWASLASERMRQRISPRFVLPQQQARTITVSLWSIRRRERWRRSPMTETRSGNNSLRFRTNRD